MNNQPEKRFGVRRLVLVILVPLLGLLAGCDANDPYQRGFSAGQQDGQRTGRVAGYEDGHAAGLAEGEKSGQETGYADGLRSGTIKGYAAGTVKIVGENWQSSLALGLCLTIMILTVLVLVKILTPPARALAEAVVAFSRSCGLRLLSRRLDLRIERRLTAFAAEDQAVLKERARLAVVQGLRAMGSHLSDERMQMAVESFLQQSVLLREFTQELDLSIQVIEEARTSILKNPDLTQEARVDLLQRLSAQIVQTPS